MSAEILASSERKMRAVLRAMERDFDRVQTGRASASLVAGLSVERGAGAVPLDQLASISFPDPRQILIQPWDPTVLRAIGGAIAQSGIGLTPTIDGTAIRLFIPPLTEERRRELAERVQRRMERARIELRQVRHEAVAALRAEAADAGVGSDRTQRDIERLQRLTDRSAAEVERLGRIKMDRLMEVT